MGDHATYGKCSGCRRWVSRDEMLSIHTDVYNASNRRRVIRQRYCPVCFNGEVERLANIEWDHIVVDGEALAPMPDGSFPSDEAILDRMFLAQEARKQEQEARKREQEARPVDKHDADE
jgi:hypothetical protein